jgi:hypothetical protein
MSGDLRDVPQNGKKFFSSADILVNVADWS